MNLKTKIITIVLVTGIIFIIGLFILKQVITKPIKKAVKVGRVVDGLQLTIKSDKEFYNIGEKIIITAQIKNINKEEKHISISNAWYEYETELLDHNGKLVPWTEEGKRQKKVRETGEFEYFKRFIKNISHGETRVLESIVLTDWYNITKSGVYSLRVFRRIGNKYSLPSNTINIKIIKNAGFVNIANKNLQLTIEPVNAAMEEMGVYIFQKSKPFKIKITLKNTGDKDLNLLTPGVQNHYDKVFYFRILDMKGKTIETDTRRVIMTHNETLGPEKIKLYPGKSHSFFAYINSNKYGIEHHHFTTNLVRKFPDIGFDERYYKIQGIYNTIGYYVYKYYDDIFEIILYSNDILVQIVD